MISSVFRPEPGTAAEGLLADGVLGHFIEVIDAVLEHVAGLIEEAHGAGGVAGVVPGADEVIVAARIKLQLVVLDEVSFEFSDVHHLGRGSVLEHRAGDGGNRSLHVGRSGAVVGGHVLVDDTPHVAAFAAEDPLDAEAFRFFVHLGVQFLRHVEGDEGTEVAAFGSVGGQGVVEIQFIEQDEVAHEGVDAGIGEHVTRGADEQDFVAAFVEGRLGPDTGDVLAVISQHFDDFLVGMRFDAEVVAGEGAVPSQDP